MNKKFEWLNWVRRSLFRRQSNPGERNQRIRRNRLHNRIALFELLETRTLLAADIAVTKVDSLFTDNDADTVADPGDTLQYDVTITNNGNMDATGVAFNDTEDGNTTLVGSVTITPIAFDDTYNLTGNTPITINAASGVLANDIDPDSTTPLSNVGVTAVGLDVTGTQGTVSLNTDGSFTFTPATGFTGLTTFNYTARDADNLDSVVTGTVTMNVSGLIWYVDSGYAGGGNDGSFNKPFTTLAPLNTGGDPDGAGQTIFVYESGSTYSGGIVLENTQSLIGESIGLTVNGMTIGGSGGNPTIATGAAANDVTLASGNTVRGFTLGNSSGSALAGTSFGTLTIDTVTINTNGQALNLATGAFGGGAAFTSITSTGGTNGISLTSVTGSVNLGSGALSGASGPTFNVSGGTVSTTYAGNISQTNNALLVNVTSGHTGTVIFNTGMLSATNGTGMQFNNADGTYEFNGTTTLNSASAGLDIVSGSSGTFTFGTGASITTTSDFSYVESTSTANVTYNGTINKTTSSAAVVIGSKTGGTTTFGGQITANTSGATAIDLNNNSGGTINFTGGLSLTTTSGIGFNATGGGSVSVTGSGNTITSTNATGLNVANTTIGASDLIFQSILVGNNNAGADPASGIILNATGSLGGLTITGTGAADSGGIIQHTTGSAIVATDTQDLSLTRIKIDVPGNHGIDAQNLRGTGMLANSSILDWTNATGNGVNLVNLNTNLTSFTVTGTTFNGTNTSNDGVFMEAQGTSNMELSIEGGSLFTEMFGDGVQVNGITGATGDVRVTVKNSTFTNAAAVGNGGISLQPFGGINFFALVDTNIFDDILRSNTTLGAVTVGNGLTADADITIRNNTINDIEGARGLTFTADGTGQSRLLIDNNSIDRLGASDIGISVNLTAAATGHVTVTNNDIGQQAALWTTGPFANYAINLGTQNTASMIALISGNVVDANTSLEVVRVSATNTSTMNATVINNDLEDTSGSHLEIGATALLTGTTNVSISGNTLPAGGVINLNAAAAGSIVNVTEASSAAVSVANSAATVNSLGVGAKNFGQPAPATPTLPTLPLLFAPGGVEALPPAAEPVTADITSDSPPAPCATGSASAAPGSLTDDVVAPSISIVEDTGGASGTHAVVDDGVLSRDELDFIVTAAAARWAATGLSVEQSAALANATFTVSSMSGWYLGSTSGNHIQLDNNAASFGWFIDSTPLDDSEFPNASSETRLYTSSTLAPAGKIDLLTTVMHEMGHILGLGDSYANADRESLIYGYATVGERRLPVAGQADGATPGSIDHEEFLVGPLNLGTLPAGKAVRVTFQVTINNLTNGLAPTISNQGTVSGGNFANVLTDDPSVGGTADPTTTALDTLTLGNQVWIEANGNSVFNVGTDTPVNNAALTLFLSDGTTQVATTTTNGSGVYQFTGLLPGDYIVRVDASNFGVGQPLDGLISIIGSTDPDNNIDNDDNGVDDAAPATNGIRSLPITLAYNTEPTAGTGNDTNNTLDFGFVSNSPPMITSNGGLATANVNSAENQTAVTDVQSTDPDSDTEGAGLTYSLTTVAAGGDDNGFFTLDVNTGLLTFTVAPDFETPGDADTDNAYEVQVTVTDSGGLTDRQDITVTVTDVNDAPVITSNGGLATANVNAAENQTAVTDVQSTDADGDLEGAGLTYSLTTVAAGGADNGLFTLNVNTGLLTFTSVPDFETPGDANTDNDYEVQVTVTDSGGLTDRQDITVTVTDVNDAPMITSNGGGATANVNAAENQTAVTDVHATAAGGD